jgi:serine/threonine-protein kinase
LAAVIRAEPDWSGLPPTTPWRVREIIERCLQKDPRDRYHDISDVRLDIRKALAEAGGISAMPVAVSRRRISLRWAVAAMLLIGAIAGTVVWSLRRIPEPHSPPVIRFSYELPEDQRVDINMSVPALILAVSRDGSQFAYCTARGIYLRSLDEMEARLIPGTAENPASPFFSPDGKWIGYYSRTAKQLKKIAVTGGTPIVLCSASQVYGAEWSSDNTIMYSDGTHGILRVAAGGGTPMTIIEGHLALSQLLPGAKSVLFTDVSTSPTFRIMIESLESHQKKEILKAEWARYLPSGHLVYGYFFWSQAPLTYAVPFNPETLKETGGRVLLPELDTGVLPAISDAGTVAFFPGAPGRFPVKGTLVWVDRDGKEQQVQVGTGYHGIFHISPDGSKLAVAIGTSDTNRDIYIYDFIRQTPLRRLTFGNSNTSPKWVPDGTRIVFRSDVKGEGVYWKRVDGNGEDEKLLSIPGHVLFPSNFSPDEKFLMFTAVSPSTDEDIGILSLDGKREWRLLLHEKHKESNPQISPDGRFMAYSSNESGRSEVYIRSFPDLKKQWQVTTDGGVDAAWCATGKDWCATGKELFYRNEDAFLAVPVEVEPELKFGIHRVLFRGKYAAPWEHSMDGKRFLLSKQLPLPETARALPRRINIILNWAEELKQRIPSR